MEVAVVCIGRLENRYAVEFVEHYKKLGFDQIIILNNNHDGEEQFEDVLQSYIDDGFITLFDFKNEINIQLSAYKKIYNFFSDNNEYDWLFFCDFDEFLILKEDKNIKEYLSRDCFKNANQILINWKTYIDNNLVYDDGRPCLERFKIPMKITKKIEYQWWPENGHTKPLIRTNIKDIQITNTHSFFNDLLNITTVNNKGNNVIKVNEKIFLLQKINYDLAYIKHFTTKTIDEWINCKLIRGVGDRNIQEFNITYKKLKRFFLHNDITPQKINYLKKHKINSSDIKNKKI